MVGKKKHDKSIIHWTDELVGDFEKSRNLLANVATLDHPSPDAAIVVSTDASGIAIGAAFNQVIDQQLKPLAFFSRKLSMSEQNYSTFNRELLSIYAVVNKYKDLLEGRTVFIHTDHKPLTYLLQQKTTKWTSRQTRQISLSSLSTLRRFAI